VIRRFGFGPTSDATPPAQIAFAGKVVVGDLDEEEASLPAGQAIAPKPESAPVEPSAPHLREETAMHGGKILKSLSSLPCGLRSSLWGLDMEDLASKVVTGKRKDGPGGDLLDKIGNKW